MVWGFRCQNLKKETLEFAVCIVMSHASSSIPNLGPVEQIPSFAVERVHQQCWHNSGMGMNSGCSAQATADKVTADQPATINAASALDFVWFGIFTF